MHIVANFSRFCVSIAWLMTKRKNVTYETKVTMLLTKQNHGFVLLYNVVLYAIDIC